MSSEETVEDPLMSVQFNVKIKSYFILCYSSSTVLFLQKTLKSVFLPRYESLALHHDRYYFVTSVDTVEDLLVSVQFNVKIKSYFILCYSSSTVFIFIARDA